MNTKSKLYGVLLSYLIGYLYCALILVTENVTSFFQGHVWFVACYILFVEYFAYCKEIPMNRPSLFWMGFLVLDCVLFSFGKTAEIIYELADLQILSIYSAATYYVLVRFDLLSEHRTGNMILLDLLSAMILIPMRNIFKRIRIVVSEIKDSQKPGRIRIIIISLIIAVPVALFAWTQLCDASEAFASFRLSFDLSYEAVRFLITLILSVPVGAYLYGLVAGAADMNAPSFDEKTVHEKVNACRIIPQVTESIVITVLCVLYTLFFVTELHSLLFSDLHSVTSASVFAIKGFWSLCRIMILNLAVLAAGFCFTSEDSMRRGLLKKQAAILMGYGLAFCVLNMIKLVIYMSYGLTIRRLIAFWALAVIFCACLTVLLHLFRHTEAVRIITVTAAVGFLMLSASCELIQNDVPDFDSQLAGSSSEQTVCETDPAPGLLSADEAPQI